MSAVALVMEDEADTSAVVQEEMPGGVQPIDALGSDDTAAEQAGENAGASATDLDEAE